MRRIPAIVSDIDGVIVRGKNIIPGSDRVIKNILGKQFRTHDNQKIKIPFVCLTNGGGQLEIHKADQINGIIKADKHKLNGHHMILNFSPLRDVINQGYKEKPVLCSGTLRITEVAQDCGLKYFITIEEYAAYMEQPYLQHRSNRMNRKELIQNLMGRYQTNADGVDNLVKSIEAVFILHDPVYWEDSLTAIISLKEKNKKLPIYVVNNDITYADQFRLPRLAFGPFTYVLKDLWKQKHQSELDIIYYGKPTLNTSNYAKNHLQSIYNQTLGNIYMIGDNPKSDIRGANQAGWHSFLVKSGIHTSDDNDPHDPATFVVDNLEKAYEKILELEKLQELNE